jgi:hypothetical protein
MNAIARKLGIRRGTAPASNLWEPIVVSELKDHLGDIDVLVSDPE